MQKNNNLTGGFRAVGLTPLDEDSYNEARLKRMQDTSFDLNSANMITKMKNSAFLKAEGKNHCATPSAVDSQDQLFGMF